MAALIAAGAALLLTFAAVILMLKAKKQKPVAVVGAKDWVAVNDPSGNTYYFTKATGETSWTFPSADQAARIGRG